MVISILCILSIAFFSCSSNVEDKNIPKRERYLLLDSRIIDKTENAKLAIGTVIKSEHNPLFPEDRPWEARYDNLYANVMYDKEEGLYKCWYSPFIIDPPSDHTPRNQRKPGTYIQLLGDKEMSGEGREMGICYAISKDGIQWEKPELGIIEFDGNKKNNLVFRGPHGAGLFKDIHDADPSRRYKLFYTEEGMSVAFSPDGLNWSEPYSCREIDAAGDTHNNAFWDPNLNSYIGITRLWGKSSHKRQVGWTKSKDFINWTKAEVVLEGENQYLHTYAMPTFKYADVYLGLVVIFNQETDRSHTELAWSTDTKDWQRIDPGTPLIPNSTKEGEYDWGCVYAAAYPIFEKNEIRLYYGGSNGLHTDWRDGFFCLATLRSDGFAGYESVSSDSPGVIITKSLPWDGEGIQLTADINKGGQIKIQVLDEIGQVTANAKSITNSGTDLKVELEKINTSIKNVQIKFILDDAKLYSFVLK
jgi:hypothetical protein